MVELAGKVWGRRSGREEEAISKGQVVPLHYNKQGKSRRFFGVLTAFINAVLDWDDVFKNAVHGAVLGRVVLSMDDFFKNAVHTSASTAFLKNAVHTYHKYRTCDRSCFIPQQVH